MSRARRPRRLGRVGLATAIVGATSAVVMVNLVDVPVASADPLCATPPSSGSSTLSGVINTYYPATSSITAGAANTTVTVGTPRGGAAVAVGDLVMVMQMQGAEINATNTGAYGDGGAGDPARGVLTNVNNVAGLYEYARVSSVSGSTIGLTGAGTNDGLVNSYVNAAATSTVGQRTFQLIRVPQYYDAAFSTTTPPTALPWDGTSGGVLALDAAGALDFASASVNVDGLGFRGGAQRPRGGTGGLTDSDYRTPTSATANGQKGEGIAGTPRWRPGDPDTVGDGYPNGDFGRGAPGNAGGGGSDGNPASNAENTGGGGGGNGGVGGTGGLGWSSQDPYGGFGGAAVTTDAARVVLGGGGGAGTDNNAIGSSAGGAGGGIVLIRANNLTGSGTITANGAPGAVSGQDGGGGGGAGGAIVILTNATGGGAGFAGKTLRANGGVGGNTTFGANVNGDRHGPGGGGAGGRIVTSATGGTRSVTGADGGIHTPTGQDYGATDGTNGANATNGTLAQVPGANTGSRCIDVSVSKLLNTAPLVPGGPVSYTVVVTNNGPFPRTGTTPVAVTDLLPAGLTGATWNCSATAGSSCVTASGSGNISTTANLARAGSATYTINATLAPSFTGTLSNTASASGPGTVVEVDPSDNSDTASADAAPVADLAITKTDGATSSLPGTNVTYTVVVSNAGPSTAANAVVADALPAGAPSGTWSCTAGACGASSGSMPLNTTVTLDPGQTATYSVTVSVDPTATGSLTNTATVTAPAGTTDPDPDDNLATDANTLTPQADVSIAKTDGVTTQDAGAANPYTLTVTNAGPSTVSGATVTDTFPAVYAGVTWTCTATPGSTCPASGSGDIGASVTLAPGGSATFEVDGTIAPDATGTLSNTATVTLPGGVADPTPDNNTATDTTTITRRADLSITKTDGATTEIPGTSVTYTIVASNAGPSTAIAAPVVDTLPAELGGATWTCVATPGSSCAAPTGVGDINTTVTLAPSGTATFTLTAAIAPDATGNLVNTATISAPGGTVDPNPGDNSATDTDTLTPEADLSITKTDGLTSAAPGSPITYTIVAANAGPSTVTNAIVDDVLPAALASTTWTCVPAGGATCPASGGGSSINANVTLPPGGTATFTVDATIAPSATGTLTNTATISVPGGVTDPDPGDNAATDTTTLTPTGDLSITKTDGLADAVPGETVTYTIVASNAGPSVMTGVAVADSFPAAVTATWTCAGSAGGTCTASGTGDIADTVTLPVGASVTYTVTATISPDATGSLVNTATVAAGPGTVDPVGGDNSATDTTDLTPTADVSITKTDGVTSAVPGETVTYTIVASNAGPSDAPGTVIEDVFPASLVGVTWTCAGAGGANCPAASGSGDIADTVTLPVGGSLSYTATGTVVAGATGALSNTATASVAAGVTDPDPTDNTATDTDTLTPVGDLVITKTDGAASAVPGTAITYTITATNAGPSTVSDASVADTLPAALVGATWTCTASAGSSCPASGTGDIAALVTLLPGGSATFTVDATVAGSATGTLSNTATITAPGGVTDPTPDNNSATDTTTLVPTADLSITKTDGATTEIPGTGVVYTVVVANAGPSDVTGATVVDTLPVVLTSGTWACSATAGSSCPASGTGDIATTVDLLAGGSATFTIVGVIDPTAAGNLVNTATVSVPAGVIDPDPSDNSATDTDTLVPTADLSITKTDGLVSVTPGDPLTYTIVVANAGPSTATGAAVADVLPASLTGATWSCSGAGGGTCSPSSGAGSFNAGVTLPPGASVTFTVDAAVAPSATGSIVNTATVSVPSGVIDPDGDDNAATDTTIVDLTADLSITKTDGVTEVVPGEPVTYTIVASNAGPSSVTGVTVTDTFPAALVAPTWTCAGAAGGVCAPAGSGDLAEAVDLPAGASVTFTVTATVAAGATGTLVNTASIGVPAGVTDPDPGDNSATDTDTLVPTADLSITKTNGATAATPGTSTTYTVVVTNAGPSSVTAAPVTDALPAGATAGSWTCAPAARCAAAAGALPLASAVSLAPGESATYDVTVDIAPTAVGSLVNTAAVAAPAGVVDPDPSDNAGTDTDTLTPTADLSVSKTDGLTTVVNGQTVTYNVVVTNPGPSTVTGATVTDPAPAQLSGVAWTCAAAGASTCTASGTGDIADTVTLAPGTTVTYTVTGTVTAAATGTITNTATVALPGGVTDPTPGNNAATDVTTVTPETDLTITKSDGTATAVPGTGTTYTIEVTNAGPADALGATVTDPLPAGASDMAWTCAATGGATCAAAGAGPLAEVVDLPVGGALTFTVSLTIDADAAGVLTNVATVAAPAGVTDTDPTDDVAIDTNSLTPEADVSVTKTDGTATAVPGGATTYTIVVANAGPSDAPATAVDDPEPAGATFVSWTCTPATGAACAATSGSGPIATTVDLPAGGSATFTVEAAIDPSATGTLANVVSVTTAPGVTDTDPGNDSATDTDTLAPEADLSITKTNGVGFVVPGTPVTYTIVAANAGPSDVVDAAVTDSFPAELTGATWTCTGAAGGTCSASGTGDIAELVTLPAGGSVTFTVTGSVPATATGTIDNTAAIAVPAGVTDPESGNDSATDSDPLASEANLSITKTDGLTVAVPGSPVTYTIVATNAGPSAAAGSLVADTFPSELAGVTWTCAGAGGATCPAVSGSGDIAELVDLPVGGSVTYTATGTVLPGSTGTLANTATVTTGVGVGDPDPGDNIATDLDTLTPEADLSITKTNGVSSVVPGTPVTYTIVVTNSGPSAVAGATVTDPFPATLVGATWTCAATAGSVCPLGGAGDIDELVSLQPGGTATFEVTATVAPDATGQLVNAATVTAPAGVTDADPSNDSATDTDDLTPQVDLTVTKTDGTGTAVPGGSTVYTIVVTNEGPSAAPAVTVDDPLPVGATAMGWTCVATAGSVCAPAGAGAIATTADLAAGGSATFTVAVDIAADASGQLENTVTVAPPAGITELTPLDNTATDIDTLVPTADLSVTKSDGSPIAVPGNPVTYTIVVANAGPSDVIGASVDDVVPAVLSNAAWTCTGTGGATCAPAGTGDIADVVDLPAGSSVTYTLTADVDPDATGSLVNTATVAAPVGLVDPVAGNDSATDTDTLVPTADLSVTKTDGSPTAVPGTPVTYTIVATNAGPSASVGAVVQDLLPASLSGATWTCAASAGSACPAGGSGDINVVVDLAVGGTATFTLTASVDPSATTSLSNTVTIGGGNATDPDPSDDSATDTNTLNAIADLSITKTDGLTDAQPGDPITYTIIVANAGPSAVVGAPVTDTFPAELGAATWTCLAGAGGACGDASGTGDIASTVDLAPGGTVTFTVDATVTATAGTIVNIAAVDVPAGATDPDPADNAATDTTAITPTADLSITKTDGLTTVGAGETVTYTVTVANAGPSTIVDARVLDSVPTVLTGVTWSCVAAPGSSCGAASGVGDIDELVTLAAGGSIVYTVSGLVPADAAAGTLTNTASVTMPAGTIDPTPANNTATDTTDIVRRADLSIVKSDGAGSSVPGSAIAYTITVSNAGPASVTGATVTDALPAALTGATWMCSGIGGGTCAAAGSGDITDTVDLPVGAGVTYVVNATVDPAATGTLVNTARIDAPADVTDTNPADNESTDTNVLTPTADLGVTKTDGSTAAVPGAPISYVITVTNGGPSDVSGATVSDSVPAAITGATWTCSGTGGGTCTGAGSGDIADTVDLPAGASVTYTLSGTVAAGATGTLTNTASVAVPVGVTDPVPGNDSATDVDTLTPQADLSIVKTDGSATAVPGSALTYTITVTNAGPSHVTGATVADTPPAALTGVTWTCTGTAGGTCAASGSGAINDLVDLPVGGSLSYELTGDVDPAALGTLTNTATVTPPATVTELTPADNTSTDTNTLTPTADLSVVKSDGLTNARPGDPVVYTVVVTNAGSSAVAGATVTDPIPPQIAGATWTCAADPGSSCPVPPNGSGDLAADVDLAVGESATFTISGTVAGSAAGVATNTATVTAPAGVTDPDPGDNAATDTTTIDPLADLSVTKTDGNTTAVAGETITYTITVTNAGPSAIADAPVTDTLPAALAGATWTCVATPGSNCDAPSGTGSVATTVDLAAGGDATITVDATIDAAFTGLLDNTASVTMPGPGLDPTPGNNTATDTTTVVAEADLVVTKTDGAATAVPGETITYTITVTNTGPSDVPGAVVADSLPAALTGATWTCSAGGGGICSASGAGDILDIVDLPVGATATYTVDATIDPAATGTLTNTATATPPATVTELTPADNTATDTTTLAPEADLSITKTDNTAGAVPGGTVTYEIVVANAGPSDAPAASVVDTFPAAIVAASWTCTGSGGATCTASGSGSIADTVDLPAGSSVAYTIIATIDPAATGTLVNTASVIAPAGVTDPDPSNDSATDIDTLGPQADLSITKTDGVTTVVPGTPVTYTITVANAGPSATDALVTDVLSAAFVAPAWSCTGVGGATCPASGTGSISEVVALPVGGSVTFTVDATVDAAATGSLVNTASVSTLGGTVDPDPSDNSATDTDGLTPTADLSITKTDGRTTARPGDTITYTIEVTNAGSSAAPGARVTDLIPAALTGATWTCAGVAGGACAASGSGDIDQLVDLPVGGSVTFDVTATVALGALGTIANTATVETPAGVVDPATGDNAATDTTAITPTADLSVSKTDGLTTVAAGAPITYTIVVTNAGPSTIAGVVVDDALPAQLVGATWTCTVSGVGTCAPAGTGSILDTITLAAGSTATYTVDAVVDAGAAPGTLDNTVTVTLPLGADDPTPADNTATDTTSIASVADLSITKTDGVTSAVPGGTVEYVIAVTNVGPSDVAGARVVDVLPAAITSATWTCVGAAGGACGTASDTGDIDELVTLPAGGSVTFVVDAAIDPAATGSLVNTATVAAPIGTTDPDPTDDSATDVDALTGVADLSITKSDGLASAVAGTAIAYTVVVANAGPSAVVGAAVDDALPAALGGAVWTCTASPGSSCSDATGSGDLTTTVDLAVGGTATFTIGGTIAPTFTGVLSNTATVAAPAGTDDADLTDNTATDVTSVGAVADVSVTKTDGTTTAVPGGVTVYTVTVANAGPSAVAGVDVVDALPAGASAMSWTCTPTVGSACGAASGTGSIATTADLAAGGAVVYTVTVTIDAAATGTLENVATIAVPTGVVDPDPTNDSATDVDLLTPVADLAVVKTDGSLAAVPGEPVTYTITVSNNGPSDLSGATVTDVVPAAITGATWTCAAAAGAICTAAGSGDIVDLVDLPAGSSVVYSLVGTVDAGASGTVVNTATVAVPAGVSDPDPSNDTSTDTNTLDPTADLSVVKSDGVADAVPGEDVTYTITVANAGPSAVVGAEVEDLLPAALIGAAWTCAPGFGASCTVVGAGDIVDTVDIPVGGSVTYTLTATVDPAATGSLVNTVSVTPPSGVTDPDPTNDTATDTDGLTPLVDLSVTKDDGRTNARPGDVLTYTIAVANAGPSDALGVTVDDVLPPELSGATWTCAGAAGGSCDVAGSGDIAELVDLPAGGSVTFTVTATVAAGSGTITNTVTVDAPAGTSDPDPGDNTATDVTVVDPTGDLSVTKTDGQASVTPGTSTTYTITVTNAGPSDAVGIGVSDTLPATLTNATWVCSGSVPGAACSASGTGDISDSVDLPAGASVTYTVVADIAPDASGTIANTVDITPPAGYTDTDPSNDSATDTSDVAPVVDLSITKTNGATSATPGLPVTYSIVVTNGGPSAAAGTRVVDTLPAELSSAVWTCTAAAGSTCAPSGTGDIDEAVTVGAGSSVTFTLTATVAPAAAGTLANTATVAPAVGVTDVSVGDDEATDVDTLTPVADLSVTKTNGRATSVPGEPVVYSIVVTNAGPSTVAGARVVDVLPGTLTGASWTCGAATLGAACDVASGSGDIDATVDLPVGATVTFELAATVSPSAAGTIANRASVTAPIGTVDPDPSNDAATDTDTLAPSVDLAITKDDGVVSAVPGLSVTYTIVVTNAGPSDAIGATVTDPLPAGASSATWTCTSADGAVCGSSSGTGGIALSVDVPVGGEITLVSTVAIDPAATGLLVNTAAVAAPAGAIELDPVNDTATDVDVLTPQAALSVTKGDGLTTALPGDSLTYTIVVTNAGPSSVTDAPVTDSVPVELENVSWTCDATGGSCAAAAGTGDIATSVSLAPGGSATFTLVGDVIASALGTIANTVTVDVPAGVVDPDPSDNAATDSTTVSPLGDVSITKTDGLTTAVAGTPTTYVVTVTNPGPSLLAGVRVQDPLPAALTGASWTCAPSGGATCAATGTGSIDELVDLPAGSDVVYTVSATIAAGATGTLVNTATVDLPAAAVDPTPANNTATDVTTVVGETALSITKTDGVTTATPGTPVTYTITATNAGPSDAVGARVTDVPPSALGAVSWTCSGTGGGVCPAAGSGAIDAAVSVPVGGSVTFALTGTIAPDATGSLVNTAVVSPPAGATDPDLTDNAASDTDALTPLADIAVTKTNGGTIVIPGTSTTYTIVVSNLGGPSTIADVQIDDPLPVGVTGATWTCSAAPGSACGAASGAGAIATTATVAPGADVTYTVTMDTEVVAGTLTNVVTATVPPGAVDPDPSNNTATDIDTLQLTADLSVTKLASVADVQPGNVFSYTVVVRNSGPNPLDGVVVDDPVPAGVQRMSWTCLPSAGADCSAPSGSGALATTVSLAVGSSATFVINVQAAADAVDSIVNTATVSPPAGAVDPDTSDNAATATVTVTPIIPPPSIELTKTTSSVAFDGVGDQLRYTLTAVNTGGVPLTGVVISDPNAQIVNCTRDQPATLAPGEQLVCDAVRTATQADLDRGSIVNTAAVVAVDPDGNTIGAVSETVTVPATITASLAITKSTTSTGYSRVGDIVRYTIVVTNSGNVTLSDVTVSDSVATLIACAPRTLAPGASMTCAAERVVTQADLDAGRIDNIATAQAVASSGVAVQAVSGVSNLVTVRRTLLLPGTGGSDGGDRPGPLPLPGTGADVGGIIGAAFALTALGVVMMGVTQRRRAG